MSVIDINEHAWINTLQSDNKNNIFFTYERIPSRGIMVDVESSRNLGRSEREKCIAIHLYVIIYCAGDLTTKTAVGRPLKEYLPPEISELSLDSEIFDGLVGVSIIAGRPLDMNFSGSEMTVFCDCSPDRSIICPGPPAITEI